MRQVLYPVDIPERCTLAEALRWVAYREYPTTDIFDGAYLGISTGSRDLFGQKQINLDERLYADVPSISENEKSPVEIAANFDKAREHLFSLLHDDKLKAEGRWSDTYETRGPRHPNLEWPLYSWDIAKPNSQEIPADFWILRGIDFEYSSAKSPKGEFQNITVATADLFVAHPEENPEHFPAEKRGKYVVSVPGSAAPKFEGMGRPPKYDWPAFMAQISAIANQPDGLPEKQADLERMMLDWCSETWGETPANSAVREKVALVFSAIQRARKSKSP